MRRSARERRSVCERVGIFERLGQALAPHCAAANAGRAAGRRHASPGARQIFTWAPPTPCEQGGGRWRPMRTAPPGRRGIMTLIGSFTCCCAKGNTMLRRCKRGLHADRAGSALLRAASCRSTCGRCAHGAPAGAWQLMALYLHWVHPRLQAGTAEQRHVHGCPCQRRLHAAAWQHAAGPTLLAVPRV